MKKDFYLYPALKIRRAEVCSLFENFPLFCPPVQLYDDLQLQQMSNFFFDTMCQNVFFFYFKACVFFENLKVMRSLDRPLN